MQAKEALEEALVPWLEINKKIKQESTKKVVGGATAEERLCAAL